MIINHPLWVCIIKAAILYINEVSVHLKSSLNGVETIMKSQEKLDSVDPSPHFAGGSEWDHVHVCKGSAEPSRVQTWFQMNLTDESTDSSSA